MIVVGPPAVSNGGGVTVVGGGTTGGTSGTSGTQVFTPPQEIILQSAQPTQVYTPPATTVVRNVYTPARTVYTTPRTVYTTRSVYTPPVVASSGNLPFTGSNVAAGLIAGLVLVLGGALILVRRRGGELAKALDHQVAALRALNRD